MPESKEPSVYFLLGEVAEGVNRQARGDGMARQVAEVARQCPVAFSIQRLQRSHEVHTAVENRGDRDKLLFAFLAG